MASTTPKPVASLSSGLLARKGEARPAMRASDRPGGSSLDDLGWNDMGDAPSGDPVALARIAQEVRREPTRAAFTLRLDPERHLRLRLASAVSNRSAQQLVTEALDAFLDAQPDVEPLVRQLATGTTGE